MSLKYSSKMRIFHYVSPWILQTLIWVPTRIFLRVFYSYKVRGLRHLRKLKDKDNDNGVIFAVNHSSELDPILIPASLPFFSRFMPMFYVSREQKFYSSSGWKQNIYGGLLFRMWGAHTAYSGMKNYDVALRYHIKILNFGKSLCIFPEGRKTRDGEIHDGRPGVGYLIHRTNAVVVPVRIKGLYKPDRERGFLWRQKLKVVFGKPMYAKDFYDNGNNITVDHYKKATAKVMDKIRDL